MMDVSPHLKAGDLDAGHVFLNSYVFRPEAKVGVISDIDIVVKNSLGRLAKNGVSYCYAIVKPTNELATRYDEKMKGSSTEDKTYGAPVRPGLAGEVS